jgi:hypothetical protein
MVISYKYEIYNSYLQFLGILIYTLRVNIEITE